MTETSALVLAVFAAVYLGMALGRWPGLSVDRTGIAMLGAIILFVTGAVSRAEVLAAIDLPTLIVLFGLMILSAQFAACGFYDWCSARIAATDASPTTVLGLTVVVAGTLSAVLANDIVVFAMTPMLIRGLLTRGLDPRPFLIGLAGAANAGSAATVIGNPQNILIGQVGHLDFSQFVVVCGPPALFGLLCVHGAVWIVWRRRFDAASDATGAAKPPKLDRFQLGKAAVVTLALLAMFAARLPHEVAVLIVAALLLVSRRLTTRDVLGFVDWHLLVLFGSLFIVTAALAATGLPARLLDDIATTGIHPASLTALAPLTLVGSNTIGNVPTVVLLLAVLKDLPAYTLYAMAVLSTLAGNLLIVGSLANIIVVERARQAGVVLGFWEHARCGIPMTLLSFGVAVLWFSLRGG